jgi:hypothetical protein
MELAKKYDGKDRFYLEAIGIAVSHFDMTPRNVILAGFDKEFPEWNDKVADLVWELQPPLVLPTLGKRLADKSLTPARSAIGSRAARQQSSAELEAVRLWRGIRSACADTHRRPVFPASGGHPGIRVE